MADSVSGHASELNSVEAATSRLHCQGRSFTNFLPTQ